jgi:hypothetical protein
LIEDWIAVKNRSLVHPNCTRNATKLISSQETIGHHILVIVLLRILPMTIEIIAGVKHVPPISMTEIRDLILMHKK